MTEPTAADTTASARYLQPGWFTQHVFNRLFRRLTRWGISVRGSRELAIRGRKSGEWRSNPVNLLTFEGQQYLVAPRGLTQWVRNLRAAGEGELRLGRKVQVIHPVELADDQKPAILREYVRIWKSEVGQFFDGIDGTSSDADLLAIAPGFPVFLLPAEAA